MINAGTLTLTYNEALDTGSIPLITDFVLSGGHIVTGVTVISNTVILTLTPSVTSTETITLDYTPGLTPIQDLIGNDAAALVGQALTNTTPAASSSGGGGGGGGGGSTRIKVKSTSECTRNSAGNYYRMTTPNTLSTFLDFATNAADEGFIARRTNAGDYNLSQVTPRKEALVIAVKMKRSNGENIALVTPDKYTKIYTDIDYASKTDWLPSIVETGLAYNIITSKREIFDANRAITRAEAFSMIMTSVCMYQPKNTNLDWQKSIYETAFEKGLTVRSWSDFAPSREILRQELIVITIRAADWAERTGGCNPKPTYCFLNDEPVDTVVIKEND